MSRIAVLGAGSFGSALALLLAKNVEQVVLWGHDEAELAKITETGCNQKYLPNIYFPANIQLETNIMKAIQTSEAVLIAVPSFAFRSTLQKIAAHKKPLIIATKGLDPKTHDLLHEVIQQEMGEIDFAILAGPSFAKEVAAGKPSAVVAASFNKKFARQVQEVFHSETFRVYTHDDVIGVEVCGVVKNVLAIGAGLSDGMQLGANARAALLTRGIAEMQRLVTALGGDERTLLGLAGVGDLMLTAMSDLSRNRRFGLALGQGSTVKQAISDIGQVVEGFDNVKQVCALAKDHNVEMPIANELYKVLFENLDPRIALQNLLMRDAKAE